MFFFSFFLFFLSFFPFLTASRLLVFSVRCEGSEPTTDHNSVGPLDVSSVFSVRRRIETHHGRRLSRSSLLSSVLSRLLRQKKDRNPPQSTTLSVLMASTPLYSRLLHQKKDLNPPQSTTLSVLIVSPASSLVFSQYSRRLLR